MAAAHVQALATREQHDAASTTTVLQPSSKTVTSGNVIVVGWAGSAGVTISGVADNLGNTYTLSETLSESHGVATLWTAPVTSAGSITAITITHSSTQYRDALAAEFSGVDHASRAVGGGLNGVDGGSSATWVANKTIPANGLAVGVTGEGSGAAALSPGAASGTPSTSIIESADVGITGYSTSNLCYAVAGASDVTGFYGRTTLATAQYWEAAGAVFGPTAAGAVIVTPGAAAVTIGTATPALVAQNWPRVQPVAAAIAITGATPSVVSGGSVSVQPAAAALSITTATPTLAATQTYTPAAASLSVAGAVPAVKAWALVQPAAAALAFTGAVPAVATSVGVGPAFTVDVPPVGRGYPGWA